MASDDSEDQLTPLRAHYLKKALIQLEFSRELDLLSSEPPPNVSTLSYLGPPFTPIPKGVEPIDLPFLRYIFRQFVLTFPFMAAAPKDFYSQKLQPFVAAMLSRNLSQTSVLDEPEVEQATRKKILVKAERNFSLFLGSATKLVEPEEVVRLTQADLDRLELLSKKRQTRLAKSKEFFEVNIVGVRVVVDKGRVRSRAHEEFIIRIRRTHYPDVYVSRRYGDFKTLAAELAKAHPEEAIKQPPPKDRSYVVVPPTSPSTPSRTTPVSPLARQNTASTFASVDSAQYAEPRPTPSPPPSRLAREKNRLTLRSYLHSLMTSSTIASSPVLRSFLTSGAISLTAEELEDARRREEADSVREDGRKRFAKEIAARVDSLRDAVRSVKGDIMGKDGLTRIFGTIKVTPDIRMLPDNYQAVTEWARISLASTVFQHFVASDDASESLAGLKRIHGLMPYFMMKAALKISNPIAMIRTVLDLFMAQPFGGKSLLQRMFTSSLTEEVRVLEGEIEAVKDKVDDPIMCAKMRQFVYAPRDIQQMFRADAANEQMNIVTVILRSAEEPLLSRAQMSRLARAHRAHALYMKQKASLEDSDDDDGPQDEDAWLIEDLRILTTLYSRLKDREDLINLIFEGFTADLLKDIITIFYSPLAEVYRAASIGDSLGDLQNFVNDLIRTVESVEELSQEDPHRTVQAFIDLIQRHEQSFYNFVHKVHSKGEGLFDSLMRWIELFLTVVREGIGEPLSLEFLLPQGKAERSEIFAEVDSIALYHYKLKLLYEDKIRRRFGRAQGGSDADAEDEATQALVNGVVGEISFGALVDGDALDMAAEDSEEESSGEEETEYETGSDEYTDATESEEESSSSAGSGKTPVRRSPAAVPSTTSPVKPSQRDHNHRQHPHPHPHHRQPHNTHSHRSTASTSQTTITSTPQPTPTRKRSLSSLSLRSARSMNFSLSNLSLNKRSQDVPPVPPLLNTPKSTVVPTSKPLPPSPLKQTFDDTVFPPAPPAKDKLPNGSGMASPVLQRDSNPFPRPSKSPPIRKKKPKSAEGPQYLELKRVPRLLPLFVEMMKPSLRSRQKVT